MPLKDGSYKGANLATRRALLEMLKLRGELSSQQMAEELGISSMAVRQHMQELEQAAEVESRDVSAGRGRPTKFWTLTAKADRYFPDRHRDLILDLLGSVSSVLGEEAMQKLLKERGEEQIRHYSSKVENGVPLVDRVRELAKARSDEGYMAEVREAGKGAFELVENHCPICTAADACRGLCDRELEVFSRVLGPDCSVERVEHLLSGGKRCTYRVTQKEA